MKRRLQSIFLLLIGGYYEFDGFLESAVPTNQSGVFLLYILAPASELGRHSEKPMSSSE